jgi:excisionase family DNA binding protein
MNSSLLENYLSRDELARELGRSTRTITRMTFQVGGIPHIQLGNRVLYRRDSVLAWLVARETVPQPQRTRGRRR